MKRILLLFVICLFVQSVSVAQEGVDFRNISLEEALEQAKAEDKLVFVDCYTPWCGPCHRMLTEVFPRKEAGDYFNSRFVCVKYDMTKDEMWNLIRNSGLLLTRRLLLSVLMERSCISRREPVI